MIQPASFVRLLPNLLVREVDEGRAAVVGGAIRAAFEGGEPKDVDVFVFDKANHLHLAAALAAKPKEGTDGFVFVLPGLVPIEIVHLPGWDSPSACIAHADFDIAAGVYSLGRFYLPDGYEQAVANMKMRFLGATEDPQRSYDRYLKYNCKYGYTIDSSIENLLQLWQSSR